MNKSVVFYLPEGFADWEGAFLMPELRENNRPMKIISEAGSPVKSIGGLSVHVEGSLEDISEESTEALILIGSDSWVDPTKNLAVLKTAQEFHQRGILVAGICAATIALGRTGILDEKKHTSNDISPLKRFAPNYKGEKNYVDKLAVTDGNLITAPGVGAVEFTLEIMSYLNIYSPEKRQQWYALFKNGTKPPMEFWN